MASHSDGRSLGSIPWETDSEMEFGVQGVY